MGCYNSNFQSFQKWNIGNVVRALLLENEDVVEQVSTNIFPLIAPEGTDGDFIVYMRERYGKSVVKQGVYEDDCELAVVAISDNYDSAIALASKIDNTISGKHTLENGVKLTILLKDSTETFDDNKYIETLVFTIK